MKRLKEAVLGLRMKGSVNLILKDAKNRKWNRVYSIWDAVYIKVRAGRQCCKESVE